ncbi:hypothetical protein LJC24_02135 [Desulfococcaceae bacterium OttesenSCG-928-F15]|nr:hypothetical protein [Desulfococcaceae bacterium OttesenSCG-928-F15]
MSRLIIIEDVLSDPSSWKQVETDDVAGALRDHFGTWPENARLYKDNVAACNDVTPHNEETVAALQKMDGTFYVVVYPRGLASIIVAVVILVTAVAAMFLFKPKIPAPTMRNTQSTSPNNELSARENEPRPNGRIPDIFGTVRSTPDLVCVPYNQYINHQEVEDCVMCIGRGQYEIHDMKDGETSVYEIDGTTVQAYLPNTNINTDMPYFRTGTPLTESAIMAARSNSVNGQILGAPNSKKFQGANDVRCRYPNIVESYGSSTFDGVFGAGDSVVLQGATKYVEIDKTNLMKPYDRTSFVIPYIDDTQLAEFTDSTSLLLPQAIFTGARESGDYTHTTTYNLSGAYTVSTATKITIGAGEATQDYCKVVLENPQNVNRQWLTILPSITFSESYTNYTIFGGAVYSFDGQYSVVGVSGSQMTLSNPAAANPLWGDLLEWADQQSDLLSPIIYAVGVKWIGPFILETANRTEIWCNFVASSGLYKDNGQVQIQVNVVVEVEVTPVDDLNQTTGPPQTWQTTIVGSKTDKNTRAGTLKISTDFTGRCRIRARRVTASDLSFQGSVVDEVRWKDLYAMAQLENANFGNVTMVRTRTYATTGALALKTRKLNCLVTRQLPRRISGADFTTELYSTRNAADIFSFVCLDKHIGNREKSEIDFDNIYDTVAAIETYFGTPLATEFCYTMDSDNLSFEETASLIATAVFCVAYRRGNIIRLFFEQKTDRSSLLFCHRNKIPGQETRTITFGYDDHDGVEYEYVSPEDDAVLTLYRPESGDAVNPDKYESIGVRNKVQAHFHACRLWNRMQHRTTTIEFEATQEANLLLIGERILVADNTQAQTQDGEVTDQAGLVVYTSQIITFAAGVNHYAFFQLPDGTVESIEVSPGPVAMSMRLARAPRLPLVIDGSAFARATYILVPEGSMDAAPFIVTEREIKDSMTVTLQAINYDDRYYGNDKDFINGLIAAE